MAARSCYGVKAGPFLKTGEIAQDVCVLMGMTQEGKHEDAGEEREPQGPSGDGVRDVGGGGSLGRRGQPAGYGKRAGREEGCPQTSGGAPLAQPEAGAGTGLKGSQVLFPPWCLCHTGP